MLKTQTALLLVAAFASSGAWAQAAAGVSGTAHKGTEHPAGVVTGGSAQTGIALHSDAARMDATVPAISGGVSVGARDNLRTQERDANVKLVFALDTGNYVADVHVKVVDSKGKVVIDDTSNGPWLLAKLPPGSYTATATYSGAARTHRLSVGRSGLRTAQFRWPASIEATGAAGAEAGGQILGTGPQELR